MSVVGIITEYNPFHEGHRLHLLGAKAHGDQVICVMSGNFVQRGEPAVYDKFTRAAFAAKQGVDLVLELPLCYSLSSASGFAYGAVATLAATGIVDTLLFGSECGDINILSAAADTLSNEAEYKEALSTYLAEGLTYPAARAKAVVQWADILKKPNNSLGIEYLLALKKLNSTICPKTIEREATAPSATKIRAALSGTEPPVGLLMDTTDKPVVMQDFEDTILYLLRSLRKEELLAYPDVNAELASRLIAGGKQDTLLHAIEYIKTKRYTMSRVKRILFNILTKNCISPSTPPAYLRVLAMTEQGAGLLGAIEKSGTLPLITKVPKENISPMLQKDIFATDIYMLAKKKPTGMDYTQGIFIQNTTR